MNPLLKKPLSAIKEAGKGFFEDECMTSGAALAFYTIFSLPPLLVIIFVVSDWFGVNDARVDSIVKQQLGLPITQEQMKVLEGGGFTTDGETDEETSSRNGFIGNIGGLGWLSKSFGIALLVFSATGLFAQFQRSLNRAWKVKPRPDRSSLMGFFIKRTLSLGIVAIIAFLLLVSLVLTMLLDEIVTWIQGPGEGAGWIGLGMLVDNGLTLFIATLLFAAMYKILPDAQTSWRDMLVGSFITALLFVSGKSVIGWYLQNSNVGTGWDSAASSLVAVLIWVYYSSLIVLFGAELTQAWAKHYGSGIKPAKGAVRIVEQKQVVEDQTGKQEEE